jgi:hypothetical protein
LSPCDVKRLDNGTMVIACSRGPRKQPRCACGRESRYQCDAPDEANDTGTCDRWLCSYCATWARHKADTHYCAEHKELAG